MNIWTIADTHFGHDKMLKEGLQKEGYEDKIFTALNTQTQYGDILIHLGDVAFYDTHRWHRYILEASNCHINILIRGNHDRETLSKYISFGWSSVLDEMKLNVYGKTILFSHHPIVGRIDYDFNIHGHLHDDNHRGTPEDKGIVVYTKLMNVKTLVGM